MKTPKYTNTNLILKYIVRYELAVNEIEHIKLPFELRKPLFERLNAEEIDHCAQLVAYPIGYNSALRILRGQEHTTGKSKKRVFSSLRNAKEYIKKYGRGDIPVSTDLATHLNKLVTKGWCDDWDQGRIKNFSEKPDELYDTWYTLSDYYPKTNMTAHLNEICKWITGNEDNTHKLIQLSILLYEMIDKGMFFAGNQITSILFLELIAKEYGYNPYNIFPFFKAINLISKDLMSAFKMSKGKNDLTIFIEALLYTLSLTANETSKEFGDIFESKILKYPKMTQELNARQMKMIDYLETNAKATRKELTNLMGVSFMTIYRDLQELMEKGYVEQKGKARGTHYILKKEDVKDVKKTKALPVFGGKEVEIY